MTQHHSSDDPCADFGPTQRWAVVWTVAILIIGSWLTYRLSGIDNWMYQNNGEFLDNTAYRDNRLATYGLGVEAGHIDSRAHGDLNAAITGSQLVDQSQ